MKFFGFHFFTFKLRFFFTFKENWLENNFVNTTGFQIRSSLTFYFFSKNLPDFWKKDLQNWTGLKLKIKIFSVFYFLFLKLKICSKRVILLQKKIKNAKSLLNRKVLVLKRFCESFSKIKKKILKNKWKIFRTFSLKNWPDS
jgi:hypothetical protein